MVKIKNKDKLKDAIGDKVIKIGDVEIDLMGVNIKDTAEFTSIIQKSKDQPESLLINMHDFFYKLFTRDEDLSDEDKDYLKEFINGKIIEIIQEFSIAIKLTTRKNLEENLKLEKKKINQK
jgi:hypothetical protein